MFRLSRTCCHGSTLNNYSCRTLFSLHSLGIDGYLDKRKKVKKHFSNDDTDRFREKMKQFVESDETLPAFGDLKNMVHLADSTKDDLQLVEGMLRKYNQQCNEIRLRNSILGPLLMRFFHHFNKPDEALKLFRDPEVDGFFDQPISYEILCDMLYEQGRYQDVIDVCQVVRTRQIQGGMNPRHVVIASAACYKQNTPESLKYCSDLLVELINIGEIPMRRAITFAAALALKQNDPHLALEMVGTAHQQYHITVRSIKALAFANLGRPDDALVTLERELQLQHTRMRYMFTKDAIATVKDVVYKSGNNDSIQRYDRIEKVVMENGHLDDRTLEDILTTEIRIKNEFTRDNRVTTATIDNSNDLQQQPDRRRKKWQS